MAELVICGSVKTTLLTLKDQRISNILTHFLPIHANGLTRFISVLDQTSQENAPP